MTTYAFTFCPSDGKFYSGSTVLSGFAPELTYGEKPTWAITLKGQSASGITSWCVAVDKDYLSDTEVMARTQSGITAVTSGDDTVLTVPLDTVTTRFLEVIDGRKTMPAVMGIYGLDTNATQVFYTQFSIKCLFTVDPGMSGSVEPVSVSSMTKAQMDARYALKSETLSPSFANITGQPTDNANLGTALSEKISEPESPVTGEFLKKTATGWETAEVEVDATRIVDGQCEITATGGVKRMGAWTMSSFSRNQYATFSEGGAPAPFFDWHQQRWVLAPAGTFSVDYDDGEYSMTGANCAKVYATDAASATELHFIIDKDGEEGTVSIGTAAGAAAAGESGIVAVVPDSNGSGYIPENALLMMGADGKLAKAVESASAQEGQFVCRTADGWGVGSVTVPVTDVTVDGSSVVSGGVANVSTSALVHKYSGSGEPTTATVGAVGDLYTDTATSYVYECTAVADGSYTWRKLGSEYLPLSGGTANILNVTPYLNVYDRGQIYNGCGYIVNTWSVRGGIFNGNVISNIPGNISGAIFSGVGLSGGGAATNGILLTGQWNQPRPSPFVIGHGTSNTARRNIFEVCKYGGICQGITVIPAATSEATLEEGVNSHAPTSAAGVVYTMPEVQFITCNALEYIRAASLDGTGYYGWALDNNKLYTASRYPSVGSYAYSDTALTQNAKLITANVAESTHECILYIDCTTTASLVFQDIAGNTITPKCTTTPEVGEKWTFLCRHEFGGWQVYGVRTEEASA